MTIDATPDLESMELSGPMIVVESEPSRRLRARKRSTPQVPISGDLRIRADVLSCARPHMSGAERCLGQCWCIPLAGYRQP